MTRKLKRETRLECDPPKIGTWNAFDIAAIVVILVQMLAVAYFLFVME